MSKTQVKLGFSLINPKFAPPVFQPVVCFQLLLRSVLPVIHLQILINGLLWLKIIDMIFIRKTYIYPENYPDNQNNPTSIGKA